MYIYVCIYNHDNHESNISSQLSPQWLSGNLCTWANGVRLHILRSWRLHISHILRLHILRFLLGLLSTLGSMVPVMHIRT